LDDGPGPPGSRDELPPATDSLEPERAMSDALPVRALVIDFDGTICPNDVSEEILEAFAPRAWWDIDLEFQRGEIGSRECLVRQGALLEGRRDDMLAYAVERFPLEPTFAPFAAWARGRGLPVTVASDGFGFYIAPMLAAAGVDGVDIRTNDVALTDGQPSFTFPNAHPVCIGCGTCKMRVVQEQRRRHGPVAFVGEGHSDRYGALYADLVFAAKHLVDICRGDGVPFVPWSTFDDVRAGLEERASIPGPADPETCPGWTEP
jgi:2,3-diketo-5-methylthio-1-phosphopentane phosphatase